MAGGKLSNRGSLVAGVLHSGKEYYAFGIEPDEIVLAYYHVNKFGFSFGDVEWR